MRLDPTNNELITFAPDPTLKPIDDAMNEIFEKYGMPRLGGASGRGWSSYATLQRCPYLFKVTYEDGHRGVAAKALETGSAFHTFMALHYSWMRDENWPLSPDQCREEMMVAGVRPDAVIEAWTAFDNYRMHYEVDYLWPLAIEEWAQGDDGNTCRYDMIAEVRGDHPGITAGTYIVEHKTAARFTSDLIEGWHNDGEVLGQIMIYKQAKLSKKYGKLVGTIVNIAGKQKIPKFHRTIVPAQAWHVSSHQKDLKVWQAMKEMYRATGSWPKARNNCVNRFGMCQLFGHCSTNEKDSPLVQIQKAEARLVRAAKAAAKNFPEESIAVATESQLGLDSTSESSDTTNGVFSESTIENNASEATT
jgi:hypothetical protein